MKDLTLEMPEQALSKFPIPQISEQSKMVTFMARELG